MPDASSNPNPDTMNFRSSIVPCFCLLTISLLSGSGLTQSATEIKPPTEPPAKSAAESLMEKGDIFDEKFQANRALNYYLQAVEMEPKNVPLLLRIARQYRYLMAEARSNEDKLKFGNTALGYGQRAAALAPHNSEAQLSPAITYGKMLPFQGTKAQVEATPLIKEAADKAIKLDARNDNAWHVLGRWHQVLAGIGTFKRTLGGLIYGKLPVTTNEASVACFERAIAINPHRLRHYIELGRTYAQMGRTKEARRHLQTGLSMADREYDDPELKVKGKEALAKLP
jgi:tetratricopeptide (TPR) repeat protein